MNLRRIAGRFIPLVFAFDPFLGIVENQRGLASFRDRPSASGKSSYRDVSTETPVYQGAQNSQPVAPAGAIPGEDPQRSQMRRDPDRRLRRHDQGKPAGESTSKAKSEKAKAKKSEKDSSPPEDDGAVGQPLAPGMMAISPAGDRQLGPRTGRDGQLRPLPALHGLQARYFGRRLHGIGTGGQLPPLLVRPHAASSAGAVCRGRAVHGGDVHTAILDDRGGLAKLLPIIADKLDLPKYAARKYPKATSPQEAIEVVKQALIEAKAATPRPFAVDQKRNPVVGRNIYPVMVANNSAGHTLTIAAPAAVGRSHGEDGPRRGNGAAAGPLP